MTRVHAIQTTRDSATEHRRGRGQLRVDRPGDDQRQAQDAILERVEVLVLEDIAERRNAAESDSASWSGSASPSDVGGIFRLSMEAAPAGGTETRRRAAFLPYSIQSQDVAAEAPAAPASSAPAPSAGQELNTQLDTELERLRARSSELEDATVTVFPTEVRMLDSKLDIRLQYRQERFKRGRPWNQASADLSHSLQITLGDAELAKDVYLFLKSIIAPPGPSAAQASQADASPTSTKPAAPGPVRTPDAPPSGTHAPAKAPSTPAAPSKRETDRELCMQRLPDSDSLQWLVMDYLLENDRPEGCALCDIRDCFTARDPRFEQAYPGEGNKRIYQAISNRCIALVRRKEILRVAEGRYRTTFKQLPLIDYTRSRTPPSASRAYRSARSSTNPTEADTSFPGAHGGEDSSARGPLSAGTVGEQQNRFAAARVTAVDTQALGAGSSSMGVRTATRASHPRLAKMAPRKGKDRETDSSHEDSDAGEEVGSRKRIRVVGTFGANDERSTAAAEREKNASATSTSGHRNARSPPQAQARVKTIGTSGNGSSGASSTTKTIDRSETMKLSDGGRVLRAMVSDFVNIAPNVTDIVRDAFYELHTASKKARTAHLLASRTSSNAISPGASAEIAEEIVPEGVGLDVLQLWVWGHLEANAASGTTSSDENKRFKVDRITELVVHSLVQAGEVTRQDDGSFLRRLPVTN